ncbi:MAG TPA: helix-turn-helix transcriptional regulator [Lacisediminihabitans sp.]|uniref:helix-turn-helix domain-containing protein n=1 Tax=Lacisediminihabitans sp. TaxID=2787631 RepID=UPI002EDB7E71
MSQPISDAARILGQRIRDRRIKLSCSQEEIAHLAGMNVSNYGKIERGLGNPNFHTIVLIASVLSIDPGTLLQGIEGSSLPERKASFTAADFVRERQHRVGR